MNFTLNSTVFPHTNDDHNPKKLFFFFFFCSNVNVSANYISFLRGKAGVVVKSDGKIKGWVVGGITCRLVSALQQQNVVVS